MPEGTLFNEDCPFAIDELVFALWESPGKLPQWLPAKLVGEDSGKFVVQWFLKEGDEFVPQSVVSDSQILLQV